MKSDKVCVDKRISFLAVGAVILIGFVVFISSVGKTQTSSSTRASESTSLQKYCDLYRVPPMSTQWDTAFEKCNNKKDCICAYLNKVDGGVCGPVGDLNGNKRCIGDKWTCTLGCWFPDPEKSSIIDVAKPTAKKLKKYNSITTVPTPSISSAIISGKITVIKGTLGDRFNVDIYDKIENDTQIKLIDTINISPAKNGVQWKWDKAELGKVYSVIAHMYMNQGTDNIFGEESFHDSSKFINSEIDASYDQCAPLQEYIAGATKGGCTNKNQKCLLDTATNIVKCM